MSGSIPVHLVTGFLGAGKTTLLNRLLKDGAFANTAIIVNEFGEIGIDHLLVETAGAAETMIELSDGCLCCTVRSDLAETLAELARRHDAGATLDRVIVETTGLADPAPVLQAVMAAPGVGNRFHTAGVSTAVCALTGLASIDGYEEARRQVALADVIVITKTDVEPAAKELSDRIRALNPLATISDAMVDGLTLDEAGTSVAANVVHDGRDHSHTHGIEAFTLRHPDPIPIDRIAMFIEMLRSSRPQSLLRMKGIVLTVERPEKPAVLHGVQSVFSAPVWLEGWNEIPRETRIVVIAKDGDRRRITDLFDALTDRIAPDTPDRQALTDNPLAIPGM